MGFVLGGLVLNCLEALSNDMAERRAKTNERGGRLLGMESPRTPGLPGVGSWVSLADIDSVAGERANFADVFGGLGDTASG